MEEVRQGSGHVFKKDGGGFTLNDDPPYVGPEVAGVIGSFSLTCHRKWLARLREAGVDQVNPASGFLRRLLVGDGAVLLMPCMMAWLTQPADF